MNRLPTLDGWRAIAILMVIAHHVAVWIAKTNHAAEPAALSWLSSGVDVFFAISGLLITNRLLTDWRDRLDLRSFYIRRAFRILPPALMALLAIGVLGVFRTPLEAISCLTFWRNDLPQNAGDIYAGHFWSLSLEEQFYLVWPVMLLFVGRNRAPRVLFWVIIGLNICRAASIMFWPAISLTTRTHMRADGLAWGCLAAFALAYSPRFELRGRVFWTCVVAVPFLVNTRSGLTTAPAMFAAIVLATVQHPHWRLSRLLDSPVLTWIGQRSYGLYLWQQLFIFVDFGLPLWLRLTGLFLFTDLSYRFFELPLQRLSRRLTGPASGEQAPPAGEATPKRESTLVGDLNVNRQPYAAPLGSANLPRTRAEDQLA